MSKVKNQRPELSTFSEREMPETLLRPKRQV